MALTRLSDRIKTDETGANVVDKNGNEVKIKRFGMWGTTAEVEIDGRKVDVIHHDGSRKRFKTKAEAEVYMKTLI